MSENNESAFERLNELSAELKSNVDAKDENISDIGDGVKETLTNLFMLLFEFRGPGQLKASELCGKSLVNLLCLRKAYKNEDNDAKEDPISLSAEKIETVEQSLLCLSALCSYTESRSHLFDETPIITSCISAVETLLQNGPSATPNNTPSITSLRDKFLSCLSNLVRGHVLECTEAGLIPPIISLLQNESVVSDLRGSTAIILSLIEPEAGLQINTRILLTGAVPLLLRTLAMPVPADANPTQRVTYRNLQTVGLRCVACLLRNLPLARSCASQFFAEEDGERRLRVVVECAGRTEDVSQWLFAAEILVWLGTVEGGRGLLGRVGAKAALGRVVMEADCWGKWPTLINQRVCGKVFVRLWLVEGGDGAIFGREQHAFLALWVNRYAAGGKDMAVDAFEVREMLCTDAWMAFVTTLLASPCAATRKNAHMALQSLKGDPIPAPLKSNSQNATPTVITTSSSKASSRASKGSNNINPRPSTTSPPPPSLASSMLLSYLIKPLGLEAAEEKNVLKTLSQAKLPLHILLRPGLSIEDISPALSNLAIGTRLAIIDGLTELRQKLHTAREISTKHAASIHQSPTSTTITKLPKKTPQTAPDTTTQQQQHETIPQCFISYCWAQKDKAKILKAALEAHGIDCWMDEQQMEGGSMLFQEIDEGISGSEVVVSCISPAYAKSVNCNREVLLAADRKKMMIPVLLEPLEEWPPRGNMGPILAGKLYIHTGDDLLKNAENSNEAKQLVDSVLQLLSTATR